MALVSGLGVGGVSGEPLAVSLLVDWLTGLLGGPEDQAQAAQVRASARAQAYSVACTCWPLHRELYWQSWRPGAHLHPGLHPLHKLNSPLGSSTLVI